MTHCVKWCNWVNRVLPFFPYDYLRLSIFQSHLNWSWKKNVAIGSGIIGLGYVANTMGYVPYIGFNIFVSIMSIFTLNIGMIHINGYFQASKSAIFAALSLSPIIYRPFTGHFWAISRFNLVGFRFWISVILGQSYGHLRHTTDRPFSKVPVFLWIGKVCECSTMVYKWADENPEKRKDKVVTNDIEKSNRDEGKFSINHFNGSSSS